MSLDYDLSGFLGAGSQLNWPNTASPQPPHAAVANLQRQQTSSVRHSGHALAVSHTQTHTGIGHHGHSAGHHPAHPKKLVKQHKAIPFGEKAF